MTWLHEMTDSVAGAAGLDPDTLRLSPGEAREILDLARIASHGSGDRTNAPLLCYVLGMAAGRGATLDTLAGAVRSTAGDVE